MICAGDSVLNGPSSNPFLKLGANFTEVHSKLNDYGWAPQPPVVK